MSELRHKLKKLEGENQKLSSEAKKYRVTSFDNLAGSLYVEEYKLNETLKDEVTKLEFELKLKQKEVDVKDFELKHLNEELEFLRIEQNQMRRRSRVMETQVKSLYEEREEILADMKNRSMIILRDHLGMAQCENEDLAWRMLNDPDRPRFTLEEMNSLLQEKNANLKRINDLEEELMAFKMEKLIERTMIARRSEERELKELMEVKKPTFGGKFKSLWVKI